jgi:DNA-directed RNA polymerase specialized sigma24 family protein
MVTHGERRKRWVLNEQAFEGLLARLGPDRTKAAEEYERLRRKLYYFFARRGHAFPEELADETLDRVARRTTEGHEVREVGAFVLGVASRVWQESLKAQQRRAKAELAPVPEDLEERERYDQCLTSCLEKLSADSRRLVVEYYKGEKGDRIRNRMRLAAENALSSTGLRSRVHRIRDVLEGWLRECLGAPEV